MDSSDDVRARLGEQIRRLRLRRKLTQAALGERAGLSHKFIGEVERGLGNPSVVTVAAIARALETDVTALFGAPRRAPAYDLAREHIAVVRDAHQRLTSAIKEMEAAARGRVRARGAGKQTGR